MGAASDAGASVMSRGAGEIGCSKSANEESSVKEVTEDIAESKKVGWCDCEWVRFRFLFRRFDRLGPGAL